MSDPDHHGKLGCHDISGFSFLTNRLWERPIESVMSSLVTCQTFVMEQFFLERRIIFGADGPET